MVELLLRSLELLLKWLKLLLKINGTLTKVNIIIIKDGGSCINIGGINIATKIGNILMIELTIVCKVFFHSLILVLTNEHTFVYATFNDGVQYLKWNYWISLELSYAL